MAVSTLFPPIIALTDVGGHSIVVNWNHVKWHEASGTGSLLILEQKDGAIITSLKVQESLATIAQSLVGYPNFFPVITSTAAPSTPGGGGAGSYHYTPTASESITEWTLAGVDKALFTINASTGVVTLTAAPLAATKATYNFTLVAIDSLGNTGILAIVLTVTS